MQEITTKNLKETKELGKIFAKKLKGGSIICLEGDLGSGKTTFSQGILEGLGAEKPYTSPTFLIMKVYKLETQNSKLKTTTKNLELEGNKQQQIQNSKFNIPNSIFHIDTYRVGSDDILDLGWEEIIDNKNNIVIVEWPERIKDIIPKDALRISFKSINENERKISYPEM